MSGAGEEQAVRATIVDRLLGICHSNDRIWKITMPGFVGHISEYNGDLTGFERVFIAIDPLIFRYGGNAHYILRVLAPARGWRVEEVPAENTGPVVDRSDASDAARFRWLLAGHGYYMEENYLCVDPPTTAREQDETRRKIDEAMRQ